MKPDRRFTRRDLVIIALLLLCAVGIAGYRYWQRLQQADPMDLRGLPGMVVFSSSECSACIAQKQVIESLSPRYSRRARFVQVDVYRHIDLAIGLGVQVMPTSFFLDASGSIVGAWAGPMSAEEIMAQFETMGIPR